MHGLNAEARPYVAIVECPIAYACTEASAGLLAEPERDVG